MSGIKALIGACKDELSRSPLTPLSWRITCFQVYSPLEHDFPCILLTVNDNFPARQTHTKGNEGMCRPVSAERQRPGEIREKILKTRLHIINGDGAGDALRSSGLDGEVLICRELLYEGVRRAGWPDASSLEVRARFLSETTGGAMDPAEVLKQLTAFYRQLSAAGGYTGIVLWFYACLCDQAMLTHILVCLRHQEVDRAELICLDRFPGIEPFNGLGQLTPDQLASVYRRRLPVTAEQFAYARTVETAFSLQDLEMLHELSRSTGAPLPFVPAAAARWIEEQPDPATGLGNLEHLVVEGLRDGAKSPWELFQHAAAGDSAPQYWGDTTLWRKINGLAARKPPRVRIHGPAKRLPLWGDGGALNRFSIEAVTNCKKD